MLSVFILFTVNTLAFAEHRTFPHHARDILSITAHYIRSSRSRPAPRPAGASVNCSRRSSATCAPRPARAKYTVRLAPLQQPDAPALRKPTGIFTAGAGGTIGSTRRRKQALAPVRTEGGGGISAARGVTAAVIKAARARYRSAERKQKSAGGSELHERAPRVYIYLGVNARLT